MLLKAPYTGETELKAAPGDCADSCIIRHADKPNPACKLQGKSSNSANRV